MVGTAAVKAKARPVARAKVTAVKAKPAKNNNSAKTEKTEKTVKHAKTVFKSSAAADDAGAPITSSDWDASEIEEIPTNEEPVLVQEPEDTYLIYDMFCGTHSYRNPLTKDITPEVLFRDIIDKEGTSYLTGHKAYARHCALFEGTNHTIESDPNDDHDVMTLHLFEYKNDDGLDVIVTLVSFNIENVTTYYQKHGEAPNMDFIKRTCTFHVAYRNSATAFNTQPSKLIGDIVTDVMVPDKDILGPIIPHPNFIKDANPLYDYQRRTIHWMLKTEKRMKKIYYGTNYKYEIKIGPLIFDPISKELIMQDSRGCVQFRGGALIDEVGLGKTIQTLTCSLMNPLPNNQLQFVYTAPDGERRIRSRATLVLSPNHLAPQWEREIKGMITRKDIRVVKLLTKNHYDKLTYLDLLQADFVFMSFNFISNACFTKVYTDQGITKSKSYAKSDMWSQQTVKDMFDNIRRELVKDMSFLLKKETIFPVIDWHRVVIDEIHEPYTVSKYEAVANIIPILEGTYKWGVTGTPFDKGTMCFNKMLDFTTNQANQLGDSIVQISEIYDHMHNQFFRRNTKKSVADEHTLPALTEKIIWSKFSRTERMMYNAYKTDPNMAKDSVILRQICCHPKIADEIKGILSECKTLEDIEQTMVEHYRKQYEHALDNVNKATKSIAKTERRILIAQWKQMRRFLKVEGYKVTIELPEFEYEAEKGMNLDSEDDSDDESSDDSDDDDKPEFKICEDTLEQVEILIGMKLKRNPLATVTSLKETLEQQERRLEDYARICKGKKSSYDFFNNMLIRIRKATEKSKRKYEKARERDMDSDSSSDSDSDSDSDSSDSDSSDSDSSGDSSDDSEDDEVDTCMICLGEISGEDVGVTKCGHLFDYDCIKQTVNTINKCPACMNALSLKKEGDVQLISFEKPVFDAGDSEVLKNKLELINKVGTKLTNLIYYLKSIDEKVIIFSQWDSLLTKVGVVLKEYGIRNVFCRGSVWARDKAIREFSDDDLDTQVIMLSSQSAASGTNLTKASKVILLDPISGSYEFRRNMEWQAVGRAYRMGQNKPVEIVRFIIKDTIEEDIYLENKKQDAEQKTQRNISETTDDIITLGDEKLVDLSKAAAESARVKKEKEEETARRRQERIDAFKQKADAIAAQKAAPKATPRAVPKAKAAPKARAKAVRARK